MQVCKNCYSPVEQTYCGVCGQKGSVGRITLKGLIQELPHAIFHVDRGFLFNFFNLFKRPGEAIINFLDGKRKPFFHPASYLLIALVLNFIVVKVTDLHFYDEHELKTMDALQAQALRDYDAMQWWFLEHTYIYILIAIPASTLFMFLSLKVLKQRFNVAESAVIVLFVISQGVLMQTMLYGLLGWIESGPFRRGLEVVNMTMLISYAAWAIYHLLSTDRGKVIRISFSLVGGIGLAIVWIASAYIPYLLLK